MSAGTKITVGVRNNDVEFVVRWHGSCAGNCVKWELQS